MPASRRKPILMIVDDYVDQLLLLKIVAERTHAFSDVQVCDDPDLAFRLLTSEQRPPGTPLPDIVLVDMKMPGIGGMGLARALHENERTARIPLIMFSSSDYAPDRETAYASGCRDFIQKPCDFEGLTAVLSSLPRYADEAYFEDEAASALAPCA